MHYRLSISGFEDEGEQVSRKIRNEKWLQADGQQENRDLSPVAMNSASVT